MTGPYPRPVEEEVTVDVGVTRERIGDVLERGIVPCANCHKPHDLRVVVPHDPTKKYPTGVRSWAGKDGHFYVKMSAEEVVRFLSRQDEDAARSVPDNAALRTVWTVKYGNYYPAEVESTWATQAEAEAEAKRLNNKPDSTGMWEVGRFTVQTAPMANVIASHDATTPADGSLPLHRPPEDV